MPEQKVTLVFHEEATPGSILDILKKPFLEGDSRGLVALEITDMELDDAHDLTSALQELQPQVDLAYQDQVEVRYPVSR